MATREFISSDDVLGELVHLTATVDMNGCQVRFYDEWMGPRKLQQFAELLNEAAQYLLDNNVAP
jgi:hypothetical protein